MHQLKVYFDEPKRKIRHFNIHPVVGEKLSGVVRKKIVNILGHESFQLFWFWKETNWDLSSCRIQAEKLPLAIPEINQFAHATDQEHLCIYVKTIFPQEKSNQKKKSRKSKRKITQVKEFLELPEIVNEESYHARKSRYTSDGRTLIEEKEKKTPVKMLKMDDGNSSELPDWSFRFKANASIVGNLLSFGNFVEFIHNENFEERKRTQNSIDFDFMKDAVDGSAGHYLYLINLIYEKFKEISNEIKLPTDFSVSLESMETNDLLACEGLRQYLLQYFANRHSSLPTVNEFEIVVKKLDIVDVLDLTTNERVTLLSGCQEILTHGTSFVINQFLKLKKAEHQTSLEIDQLTEKIVKLSEKMNEVKAQLLSLESVTVASRTVDRKIGHFSASLLQYERVVEETTRRREIVLQNNIKTEKILEKATKMVPLGYDRNDNCYWYFPELRRGIFVESGSSNGQIVPISKTDDLWSFYEMNQVSTLIDALSPLGVKEEKLKRQFLKIVADANFAPSLPPVQLKISSSSKKVKEDFVAPAVVDVNALAVADTNSASYLPPVQPKILITNPFKKVKEDVVELTNQFVANQFLSCDFRWGKMTTTDDITLNDLKKHLIWLRAAVLKPILKLSLREKSGNSWKEAVKATKSLSRFCYLVEILRLSIDWNFRLTKESVCDLCGHKTQSSAAKLRRCHVCVKVQHDGKCAEFEEDECHYCRSNLVQID